MRQPAAPAPTWAGELVTVTPAASSARILSWAVPLPPATILVATFSRMDRLVSQARRQAACWQGATPIAPPQA